MVLIAGPGGGGYSAEEVVKTQTTRVSTRIGAYRGVYDASRAQNVATNDQTNTQLGPVVDIYDPEWIAWLSGDI